MSRRSSGEGTAGAVLGAAARILIYGAVLAFLVWGVRAGYRFGEEIFYPAAMSGEPGRRWSSPWRRTITPPASPMS